MHGSIDVGLIWYRFDHVELQYSQSDGVYGSYLAAKLPGEATVAIWRITKGRSVTLTWTDPSARKIGASNDSGLPYPSGQDLYAQGVIGQCAGGRADEPTYSAPPSVALGRAPAGYPAKWKRITDWVRTHAQKDYVVLNAPAPDPAGKQALAAILGRPLPPDLAAYFDSVPTASTMVDLLPFYQAVGASKAASDAQLDRQIQHKLHQTGNEPHAGDNAFGWQKELIPIAEDGAGDWLGVDLRSGPKQGCVFEFDLEDGYTRGCYWDNLGDMLTDIAESMEQGRPVNEGNLKPHITNGRLDWQ